MKIEGMKGVEDGCPGMYGVCDGDGMEDGCVGDDSRSSETITGEILGGLCADMEREARAWRGMCWGKWKVRVVEWNLC